MTPGLAGNPRVVGDPRPLIRVVLHGLRGGAKMPMAGFAQQLSDAEIAALLTYVRQNWGNAAAPVAAAMVTEERSAAHPGPWTAAELGW
jgi:mono/diheme cytochrome c family protein